MKKLMQIEWMKLRRLNTMKAILIIYAVLVPVVYWLLSFIEFHFTPDPNGPSWKFPDTIYQFPDAFHYVTYISSWLNLAVGVIIIVFTTNELKYKTQRQNMIDGLSKREIILSKFFVVILLSAIVTLYNFIVGFTVGAWHGMEGFSDGIHHIGAYFISTLGYFSFAFFFANLVRLPALAIVLYIASTTVEGIVGFIAVKQYAQYFPLSTFAQLIPMPIIPDGAANPYILTQGEKSLLALGYITIFVLISYWVIKRRDI